MDKLKGKYKFILWDVDGTLVDFQKSEKESLLKCFKHFGVFPTELEIAKYSEINKGYWLLLEQGKIQKSQLLIKRFEDFFEYLGIKDIDANEMNQMFQKALGENCVLYDNALELCSEFQADFKQFVVTNGTAVAQNQKLKNTGLFELMDDIFISEELGFEKPDIRFFNCCFERIPGFIKEQAIIIGDSLTSDMQGGNNAQISCCWYNPKKLPNTSSLKIDYVIENLQELKELL